MTNKARILEIRTKRQSPASFDIRISDLIRHSSFGLCPYPVPHLSLRSAEAYSRLTFRVMKQIGIAIIGCGGITLQNHLPGLALCPEARVVALCDSDAATLQKASEQTGVKITATKYEEIAKRDEVDAVIVATPNFLHAPIALTAIAAGKHVLCEKPLAMSCAEAKRMADAADRAGVRHMTAFTYRFVPAMR